MRSQYNKQRRAATAAASGAKPSAIRAGGRRVTPTAMTALLAVTSAALFGGCTPSTIPHWARHIKPPHVRTRTTLAREKAKLISELEQRMYEPGHAAPEQIATLAVHELHAGRDWDASLLLTLASYRYDELARYAESYGLGEGRRMALRQTRGALNERTYRRLIEAEVDTFSDADFDAPLERVAAKLGTALTHNAVQNDLRQLAMGNIHDRYSAEHAFRTRFEALETPRAEELAHPDLAEALLERLRWDARFEENAIQATYYLSMTPLRSFRRAALQWAPVYFSGPIVRAALRLYQHDPQWVVDELRSTRAPTRTHAAVALGITEAVEHLPQLESAIAGEPDPFVRLALSYALVRMGEHSHLPHLWKPLEEGLPTRQYAIYMLQWLPEDLQLEVPRQHVVAALHDRDLPLHTRVLAAAFLRDIGRREPLDRMELFRLFQAVRFHRDVDWAFEALCGFIAELPQLERNLVLRALRTGSGPTTAWIYRWRHVIQPQDLDLARQLMDASTPDQTARRSALVEAVAAVPGVAAQSLLEHWYHQYEEQRVLIAIALVLRHDVDKARLAALAESHDDVYATLLHLPLESEQADVELRHYLLTGDAPQRLVAALAAQIYGNRKHTAALWHNVVYHNEAYYPQDVRVRLQALHALVNIELNRGLRGSGSPSTPQGR